MQDGVKDHFLYLNMESRLKLALYYTTTLDRFLFNKIVNFEKYEI